MDNLVNFEIEEISEDPFIETVNYRNFSIPVYRHENFFYIVIEGKYYKLCDISKNYKDYLTRKIDFGLDLIHDFGNDTYLVYFDNAGHKDIKLYYKNRLIKIFLVANGGNQDEIAMIKKLVKESADIITKLVKLGQN